MHNNIQQTTFWNFLKKRKIEIPIIQRDYAQGRIGKEKLREKFLTDIKKALDRDFQNNAVSLKLDFVYGSVENNSLNPLDGQQRLTTLWLLHWFIAYKAGVLQANKEIFKKFTYETRTTSREFCNKLSDFDIQDKKDNVVGLIQNQTWFFSAWKQDPTIQAMLNMLGGTPIKDDKENDIIDGLEEVFCAESKVKFEEYWEKLTSNNCPIIFYYLDLLGLTLSDDLYIKMNARGKQLTNFENFKADLVGWYVDKNKSNSKVKNPEKTVSHKLDTIWTDIFWKYKSPNHRIDEIYFAFFNRYFLNKIITAKYLSTKDIESNKLFKYLYGKNGDDTNIQYNGFDIYKLDINLLENIESAKKVLDAFHSIFNSSTDKINKMFLPSWNEYSDFRFIPEYDQKKNKEKKDIPTSLTQPQRVVFYAICCYFEKDAYQESSFKQWMRVVWNIVENANIYTIQAMIGAMRLIDDLGKHSHKIYEHLKDRDVSKDFARGQMEEEKEKTNRILNDSSNEWEGKIIEAEKTAFCKGATRFLFRINANVYDWGKFNERFEKTIQYFDENGATQNYKKDAVLLRTLISLFSDFEHFKVVLFENNASSWKSILLNEQLISPLNELFKIKDVLTIDFTLFNSSIANNDKLKNFQNDLCKSTISKYFSPKSYFHWRNHNRYSIFPYNTKSQKKIFVFADKRNAVLSDLENKNIIKVDDWQKVHPLPYYKGWKIYFTLKSNSEKFQWWDCLKEQNKIGEWISVADVTLDNLEQYLVKIIKKTI